MEVFQRVRESHRPQKNLPAAMCFISAPSFLLREREREDNITQRAREGSKPKKKGKERKKKGDIGTQHIREYEESKREPSRA